MQAYFTLHTLSVSDQINSYFVNGLFWDHPQPESLEIPKDSECASIIEDWIKNTPNSARFYLDGNKVARITDINFEPLETSDEIQKENKRRIDLHRTDAKTYYTDLHGEKIIYEPKKPRKIKKPKVQLDEMSNIEINYDNAYAIALMRWKSRISMKKMAEKLETNEKSIKMLKESEHYLKAIEDIIFNVPNYRCSGNTPTHKEIHVWITDFPKQPMHEAFAKIMGIKEGQSEKLINGILEKLNLD